MIISNNNNDNDSEPDQTIEISHDSVGSAIALVTVEDEDFGTLDMRENQLILDEFMR